jgi:hypothetical protein
MQMTPNLCALPPHKSFCVVFCSICFGGIFVTLATIIICFFDFLHTDFLGTFVTDMTFVFLKL